MKKDRDMGKDSKGGRGGRRAGAGRPKGDTRLYTFRAGGDVARALDAQRDKTAFIKSSIEIALRGNTSTSLHPLGEAQSLHPAGEVQSVRPLGEVQSLHLAGEVQSLRPVGEAQDVHLAGEVQAGGQGAEWSRLGRAVPAGRVRGLSVPSFEVRVVAGFPVPLDNDERSQDIDMLRLLCPHPESSYLIRVQGESMIDAGIENGDIVIVDKSRRDPSGKEIAVCELNGEYTLKRVAMEKDGTRWLVPANPDFPRFPITDGDSFRVWGVVTYIIHKARD